MNFETPLSLSVMLFPTLHFNHLGTAIFFSFVSVKVVLVLTQHCYLYSTVQLIS